MQYRNHFDIHGPAIHKTSYKKPDPEQKNDPSWIPFLSRNDKDGLYSIDLIGYTVHQLTQSGIPKENITIHSEDTVTSSAYFSHYQSVTEKLPEKRFATIAKSLK